jgi:hypothetical protein
VACWAAAVDAGATGGVAPAPGAEGLGGDARSEPEGVAAVKAGGSAGAAVGTGGCGAGGASAVGAVSVGAIGADVADRWRPNGKYSTPATTRTATDRAAKTPIIHPRFIVIRGPSANRGGISSMTALKAE